MMNINKMNTCEVTTSIYELECSNFLNHKTTYILYCHSASGNHYTEFFFIIDLIFKNSLSYMYYC